MISWFNSWCCSGMYVVLITQTFLLLQSWHILLLSKMKTSQHKQCVMWLFSREWYTHNTQHPKILATHSGRLTGTVKWFSFTCSFFSCCRRHFTTGCWWNSQYHDDIIRMKMSSAVRWQIEGLLEVNMYVLNTHVLGETILLVKTHGQLWTERAGVL